MSLPEDDIVSRFCKMEGHYFLSHSAGLLPKTSPAALEKDFFSPWRQKGGEAWSCWMPALDGFHESLTCLLNVPAPSFCAQSSVSSALTKIIFSIPRPKERPVILLSEQDFPTTGFVLAQAQKVGWQLRFLPRFADLSDPQIWQDAMKDDVGLVFVTHVTSNFGARAPLGEICEAARAKGIISILDLAQSVGGIAIDLGEIAPDFAIGSSLKYLCGGPGAGWLYVAQKRIGECQPLDVGWFSHENPFEFDIHDFRYAPDAKKFLGGTPSIAPLVVARNGIDLINETGVDAIEAHNQALLQKLIEALPEKALASETRPGHRGNHILVKTADPEKHHQNLAAAGIQCDIREGALRFSVHLYTSKADIIALLSGLEAITDL
jgi:kynureninase